METQSVAADPGTFAVIGATGNASRFDFKRGLMVDFHQRLSEGPGAAKQGRLSS